MKLDPEAFTRGKEQARADRQRVAAGREDSGNAFLSGRELAIEDALASKAHIDALAAALHRGGLPGTLRQLRVLAFNDLTQGRDPRARLTTRPAAASKAPAARRLARSRPTTLPRRTTCPAGMQARAKTTAQATAMMTTPAGTAAPTCPNGSTSAAAPPKTMTTRTAAVSRPARRPVPGADQPHHPGRHRLRLVVRPRRGRRWDYSTTTTPAACCRPPPCIPVPAGAPPCWPPTAPRSRTAAPAAPTPGSRRRTAASETATDPAPGRPPRSPACCATSTSPSPRSPREHATTAAPRTATPPAGN